MYIDYEHQSKQWEKGLQEKIFSYGSRQKTFWRRDYSNVDRYLRSVLPNRNSWRQVVEGNVQAGSFGFNTTPLSNHLYLITGNTFKGTSAQALLALPDAEKPYPLVVCLHGMDGTPEMVLGLDSSLCHSYHDFGARLLQAGYAVLVPAFLNTFQKRNRIARLAVLLGTTLWGLEIQMLQQCLAFVCKQKEIDSSRLAMWGISMGGAYALYTMPLECSVRGGIVSAWFNHRLKKMVIEDSRYSCFLTTSEEHAFIPDLLSHFSDSDLVSLICPRHLQIQSGDKDDIHWIPFVRQEVDTAKSFYKNLCLQDRIEWVVHPGGHEVRVEEGLLFLKTLFRQEEQLYG